MDTDNRKVIMELQSREDATEKTVVAIIGNNEKVDVRRYFKTESGEWLPTKKGIRLSAADFLDIAEKVTEELDTEVTEQ